MATPTVISAPRRPRCTALTMRPGTSALPQDVDGHAAGEQAGDRVFFEPGEDHWHGAAPNRFMTHIAMHEADDSGSTVTWGEHVTDEEYAAAPATAPSAQQAG